MKIITSDKAPKAIGPYSQAVQAGDFLFLSGSIPIDPKTGEVTGANVREQAKQVLENIKGILEDAGADFSRVCKASVFLKDLADFNGMNEVYSAYFGEHKPARSTFQVAALPRDVLVEIEVVVYLGKND